MILLSGKVFSWQKLLPAFSHWKVSDLEKAIKLELQKTFKKKLFYVEIVDIKRHPMEYFPAKNIFDGIIYTLKKPM